MNCGTFELQRITAAIAEVMKRAEPTVCASCLEPLAELNMILSPKRELRGYACLNCNAKVCTVCGCTDARACNGGSCHWIAPGICSTHQPQLEAALARHGVRLSAVC
jgi:hypothetical protein